MDQKKLTQLDPKLKEAYERVMGLNIPQPTLATQPSNIQPQPNSQPNQTPPKTSAPSINQPTIPQSNNLNESIREPKITSSFTASNSTEPNPTSEIKKGKKKISPILIATGIVIFFVSYTIIWVKIFKLSIPFLPNF